MSDDIGRLAKQIAEQRAAEQAADASKKRQDAITQSRNLGEAERTRSDVLQLISKFVAWAKANKIPEDYYGHFHSGWIMQQLPGEINEKQFTLGSTVYVTWSGKIKMSGGGNPKYWTPNRQEVERRIATFVAESGKPWPH